MLNKKAQLTLFIIIAGAIIAIALITFFIFQKTTLLVKEKEVEYYFIDCVNEKVKEAVTTTSLQGGYLKLPVFEEGSEAYPFSNYFKFLTLDIPYWYYVSGNGIQKIQKPSIKNIEKDMKDYLQIHIEDCFDFKKFNKYEINFTKPDNISVKIKSKEIETKIFFPLIVKNKENKREYSQFEHVVITKSSFGSLYESATQIFNAEKEKSIIANYSLDVINAYAPTTGLEISCVPKIWQKKEVIKDIKEALQENLQAIKIKNQNSFLKKKENKYFLVDLGNFDKQVNFLYLKNWPTKIEIWPSSNDVLESGPIGQEAGLGIIGFCFIPYHFVYDLYFPVLVQITSGTEIFQFPILIVIDKMVPKKFEFNETIPSSFDLCSDIGQEITIFTEHNSVPVEAKISFRCLKQTCDIGKTVIRDNKAILTKKVPRCVNGYLIINAEGYKNSEILVSTNEPFVISVNLEKLYEIPISINIENDEKAIIFFKSEDYSTIIHYPEQNVVNLSAGDYYVSVQIYKEFPISVGQQKIEKCIEIPAAGISGIIGLTNTQCFNLDLPATQITSVPIGGGNTKFSVIENELKKANKIKIRAEKFDISRNIEEVAYIYDLINFATLEINLN